MFSFFVEIFTFIATLLCLYHFISSFLPLSILFCFMNHRLHIQIKFISPFWALSLFDVCLPLFCISNIFLLSLTVPMFVHFHFQICTLVCVFFPFIYILTKLFNSIQYPYAMYLSRQYFLSWMFFLFHSIIWLTVFTFNW